MIQYSNMLQRSSFSLPAASLLLMASACLAAQTSTPKSPAKPAVHHAVHHVVHHAATTSASGPVVLTVGTEKITAPEFEALIKSRPPNVQSEVVGHKRELAEQFGNMLALVQEAKRRGMDREPSFEAELALTKDNLLARRLVTLLGDEAKPTDAQAKAYYDARAAEFEEARVRHILIADVNTPRGSSSKLTEAEAKAKADAIEARLKKGEDFATIAKAESDDPGSKAQGGELGLIGHGVTVPEFEQKAFSLPVNQISEPFKTAFGYHIMQVEERKAKTFDAVKPQIIARLADSARRAQVDAITKAAPPVLNAAYFAADTPPAASIAPRVAPSTAPKPAAPVVKPVPPVK